MDIEKSENTTKYGEFVCSFYQWLPLDKQKEQAEKLVNITRKKHTKDWQYYVKYDIIYLQLAYVRCNNLVDNIKTLQYSFK